MGRRPKPTAAKELAGNPGKRKLALAEPKPKINLGKVPKPPAHLGRFARKFWTDYAPMVVTLGLLSEADPAAFEFLADTHDRYRQAKADVKKHGRVYVKDGIARLRPEVRILAEAAKEFRQWCAEFGFTPASRSRVAASLADQPTLPMDLPEREDPNRPAIPPVLEDEFGDDDYFGPGETATRH